MIADVSFQMVDSQNRAVAKTFRTANLADYAAVAASAADMAQALADITGARILSYIISVRTVYNDVVSATANRDEGITLVMRKANNYKDVVRVPAPLDEYLDGNGGIDIGHAGIEAFVSMFLNTGSFTFSDGEVATEVLYGSLDK